MEQRNLGRSGLRVSTIGLGCNNFGGRVDLEASRRVVHAALDAGITLFDTADVYGALGTGAATGHRGASEEILGEILGTNRREIVLASKFGMPMDDEGRKVGASRRYIVRAVEDSLTRLKTDWIDLYQQHRFDPLTPIEESLRALDDLVRAGKVRYIGCSNFAAWQVADAMWTAKDCGLNPFVSCQDELSLLVRDADRELLPAMEHFGLGLLPYFPLASGLLTGKYQRNATLPAGARLTTTQRLADRYLTETHWPVVEKLADFCAARGRSMVQLAFSWLLARGPVASVIAGATKAEQVAENAKAGDWTLSAAELAEIDAITAQK
jgi:aryl-alcohol dehydrogenase-like predicted oxidoreductase